MGVKNNQLAIAKIIRTMIAADDGVLNVEMAKEATNKLGCHISRITISRIRNKIGLGMYDQIHEKALEAVSQYRKNYPEDVLFENFEKITFKRET